MIDSFIEKFRDGLSNLHNIYVGPIVNDLLFINLAEELKCSITEADSNLSSEDLDNILFYRSSEFFKSRAIIQPKKINCYLCPGCAFVNKESILGTDNILHCKLCFQESNINSNPVYSKFHSYFANHSKIGYRCGDCKKFVPQPLDGKKVITCPYPECIFVGEISSLKKMHHPSKSISEELNTQISNVDMIIDNHQALVIQNVIEEQSNAIPYNSSSFTIKQKMVAYQAISNILNLYPDGMVSYLIKDSRSGGFQSKIFQEYIKLMEESLPFQIKKSGKYFTVTSLLDNNLSLFDGISSFDSIVNEKLEVKNNTQEFYVGGRKGSYAQPFFIGKILSILDDKGNSILENIKEYNFSKIKLHGIGVGTKVKVKHLRVPPHYQLGAMAYINRARKNIVDNSLKLLDV